MDAAWKLWAYSSAALGLSHVAQQVLHDPYTTNCSSKAFTAPQAFGCEVLHMSANEVSNYSTVVNQNGDMPPASLSNLQFCNVTVTYTHPGQHDLINVYTYLPMSVPWNGRFLGLGGGGWSAGDGDGGQLAYAVSQGFAASTTDSGHELNSYDASSWALLSPGNIDWNALMNFAHISLTDMTQIGKSVVTSFFGEPARHAYFHGCSTGGRQGMMLAQRYADAYDGILAIAPAMSWSRFLPNEYWPQQVMNMMGAYPPGCELDAITARAVEACDELDGARDGVVAAPEKCNFDPYSLVGKPFDCEGEERIFSEAAAKVVQAAWTASRDQDGNFQWHGVNYDAPLMALTRTHCKADMCSSLPFPIAENWLRLFLLKDPSADLTKLSRADYDRLYRVSQQFSSIMNADDPNLYDFRSAGGKMIHWHGMSDEVIPLNGSREYYREVLQRHAPTPEFYRYFEVPGVTHCKARGPGAYPDQVLDALVRWVEDEKAPEHLDAAVFPGGERAGATKKICPYPRTVIG